MANEIAVIEKNWLSIAGQTADLPVPFEQTVFLTDCHLAGTEEIDDILVKTHDVDAGTPLVLKRATTVDAADVRAVSVETSSGTCLGYVPRRYGAVMARLMDAGISCGGTVAVQGGSTLTVNAASTTSVSDLLLEADSTLNIANYDGVDTLRKCATVQHEIDCAAFRQGRALRKSCKAALYSAPRAGRCGRRMRPDGSCRASAKSPPTRKTCQCSFSQQVAGSATIFLGF